MRQTHCAALLLPMLLAGCQPAESPAPLSTAASGQVSAAQLLVDIKALSSDDMQGRLPGTAGADRAVAYIVGRMKAIGAEPGNPDGSYLQQVPLVGLTGTPTLQLTARGKSIALAPGRDYVAVSPRFDPRVDIENSPLVFVGYGVQAPEYQWDDYRGLDARGKTLVMLINDPPVVSASDPAVLDEHMFKGKAMTYYGRWTYKYEIGAKLHAAAVLIVHETEPAAYGWNVVQSSWSGEQFRFDAADGNRDDLALQGWISADKARELLAAAGQDFAALKRAARTPGFRPVPLAATLSGVIRQKLRRIESQNVVGLIPGSDPVLRDQYVIYTAHWDHLGLDRSLKGDQIYNGAADNASGVASLLAVGQAFASGEPRPKRSILLLSVTAEEQGLLGSAYYALHPLYPLARTLADINMDVMNVYGRTRDIQVPGYGQNTLEDRLQALLASSGRTLVPDQEPEKGHYFRSDHFSFARVGVPAISADAGVDVIGKPAGYGQQMRADYVAHRYHGVGDEVRPDWDLSGAAEDTLLLYRLGLDVANGNVWPSWRLDSEFRQVRESSLRSIPAPLR